jgi:6-phosphogluconolactonase (cycloisomerase 2 family)
MRESTMSNIQRRLGTLALLALAACGGGGGGGGGAPVVAPSNLVFPRTVGIFLVDVPIASDLPTYSGSPSNFSVLPALPAGLSLNAQTGNISGTPTQASSRTIYTVTARNSAGSTAASLEFSVALPPRFAYVLNQTDSTITVCTVDADTGRLHHESYRLAPSGELGPERMTVHPDGRFAYVADQNTSNLSIYAIDPSTGWLTPVAPVALGNGPHDVTIDPAGRFLFATSQNSNQLHVFSINATTGALTLVQLIPTAVQPSACAVDPLGKFLFVTLHGNPGTGQLSAIQSYQIDPVTGAVTSPTPSVSLNGSQPTDVVVDPTKNAVYVSGERFDFVIPLNYDLVTGALTLRQARITGDRPVSVSVDPTGRFAYVANLNGNSVSCFAVDQATGDLTLVSTVAAGTAPDAVQTDPSGQFVYVLNSVSQGLAQYRINEATGGLALEEGLATRAAATHIGFAQGAHPVTRVPRFVHVAASSSDEIPTYTIASSTGVLTEVGNPPLTDSRPVSVATDPLHRFLYVANQEGRSIGTYTINATNGVLAAVGTPAPVSGKPTHATVDQSGRFLYVTTRDVANPSDGWVTTWVINQNDGSLSLADTHQVGDLALWAECEPTGTFLYVASKGTTQGSATVTGMRISPTDGTLTDLGSSSAAGVTALGFHPYKRALYAVLSSANAVVTFTIDAATGDLTIVPGGAGNSGLDPTSIAITPDGRFTYVCYYDPTGTGHVSAFSIDAATGKLLVPATQYQDGLHPSDLDLDGSGRYLYASNSGSNDVSLFRIDPATGVLTLGTPKASGLEPNALVVTTVIQ